MSSSDQFGAVEIVSYCFMFLTGFFLSLVRMVDPYYRHVLKQ